MSCKGTEDDAESFFLETHQRRAIKTDLRSTSINGRNRGRSRSKSRSKKNMNATIVRIWGNIRETIINTKIRENEATIPLMSGVVDEKSYVAENML